MEDENVPMSSLMSSGFLKKMVWFTTARTTSLLEEKMIGRNAVYWLKTRCMDYLLPTTAFIILIQKISVVSIKWKTMGPGPH